MSRFPIPSFSHSGEDLLLHKLFLGRQSGFYVDVGCCHPSDYSNTYILYMLGWRGVVIDADPTFLGGYKTVRPNDIVVHSGVGEIPGEQTLYTFQDRCLNTLDPAVAKDYAAKGNAADHVIRVPVDRLASILRKVRPPKIDLMNVDVEGFDLQVLRSNSWNEFRPEVLAIEDHELLLDDVPRSSTYQYLKSLGYALHSKVNYTSVYISSR